MKRGAARFLVVVLAGYAAFCAFLYAAQDSLLYFPTPETPSRVATPFQLEHDGETLQVWRVGDGKPAILYFGGNAENVARSSEHFARLFPGHSVYLPNYRGYGGSTGEPGQQALFADALFVHDRVAGEHGAVSVIGRSLGSGVAVRVASARTVARLVLITPYDSIENVARAAYPFVPVSLLLRDRYPSIEYVSGIEAPTLVLMAEQDNVVPHGSTLSLVRHFPPSQVRVRTIANSNHATISRSAAYDESLRAFIADPAGQFAPPDSRSVRLASNPRRAVGTGEQDGPRR